MQQQKKLTFLGRIISNSLSVSEHFSFIENAVINKTNLLRCLNVYRSVVRSKIEYSKTTTANSPQYIKKKVERLIDMIKRSLGVPKSSPTLVVYTLAGEIPPAHRAQFLTAKRSVGWSYEIQISYDIIADNPLVRLIFPTEIPHIRTNLLAFKKENTDNDMIQAIYKELAHYKMHDFELFGTDASVKDNATGCGIYNTSKRQRFIFKIDLKTSSTLLPAGL